jgi:hypothetical protein
MSIENRNKLNWKDRLEDLDSHALDQNADPSATWERLRARLHKKDKRQKQLWVWIAAACIFFAILFSWIYKDAGKNDVVNAFKVETAVSVVKSATENTDGQKTIIKEEPPIATRENVQKRKNKGLKINHQDPVVEDESVSEDQLRIETTNSEKPVDTFTSIAASLPEKKKFKLVHINELANPYRELMETKDPKETMAVIFDIGRGGAGSVETLAPPKPRVFKIKLTTPN